MKDFLLFLLNKIVAHPDSVVISQADGLDGITFDINVHPDDSGTIIGKGGRTIQAIRTLLSIYQNKHEIAKNRLSLNVNAVSGVTATTIE